MGKKDSRYLMIYIEPTPYIAGLLDAMSRQTKGVVDVLFLKENGTQQWNIPISGINAQILPSRLIEAIPILYRTISKGRFRVVHLAGWSELLILFSLITAWLHCIPVTIESDTPLPATLPVWKKVVKRLAYPRLFKMARMLLPGGSRQAAYFRHYGVEEERIMIAGMTVDVAGIMRGCAEIGESGRSARRMEMGFSQGDVAFVFVGRLLDWKGVENLLESFGVLSRRYPQVRLIIAGDGPMRDRVMMAAERNKSIRYMGRLDSAEVVEVLHASDVSVVPSHAECWGLVVNEAMAAGLPVIATDMVGCVDDLVIDELTGKVIRNDRNALTAAMKLMVENGAARRRMGNEGRKLIADWTLEREARIIHSSWLTITEG